MGLVPILTPAPRMQPALQLGVMLTLGSAPSQRLPRSPRLLAAERARIAWLLEPWVLTVVVTHMQTWVQSEGMRSTAAAANAVSWA